ncbi:MAG: heparinase II/III family protein [Pseudomonadota bacterium]
MVAAPTAYVSDLMGRFAARRADARGRQHLHKIAGKATFQGLNYRPAGGAFGDFNAARAALDGTLALGGLRMKLTGLTPWELEMPSHQAVAALHGFAWLDDFVALSGRAARGRAQAWALGWLDRYGDGAGPGWTGSIAGKRFLALLGHLSFLEEGMEPEAQTRLNATLPVHMAYLVAQWADTPGAAGRLTALSAALHGAVYLTGHERAVPALMKGVQDVAASALTQAGGLPSRNPEALLDLFRTALMLRALLAATERQLPAGLETLIADAAPTLRLLRTADGGLARFHGGGAGPEGELDRALAESRVRTRPGTKPAMGYVRLTGGRAYAIVDVGRPAEDAERAHASTLAFEMGSGRCPVFVNCGPQMLHLPDWRRAPRLTPAHSTLALDKVSSSRLPPARQAGRPGRDGLLTRPSMVTLARSEDETGMWIQARHDGYLEDYGLLHERRLFIGRAGDEIQGEDVLLAPDAKAQKRFHNRTSGMSRLGVGLSVHFHLHPDVAPALDRSSETLRLTLSSGEIWAFQQAGGEMDLESSVYLERTAPAPVPTRQIVIRSRTTTHAAEIRWSLTRVQRARRMTD